MFIPHVALVSESTDPEINFGYTARIAAALQEQVINDLEPVWRVTATVSAFETLDDVPPQYWVIVIRDQDGRGTHREEDGKPFGLVSANQPKVRVPLSCSHELLEMLTDPAGNRFIRSMPPPNALHSEILHDKAVDYLVEICDPCLAFVEGYEINGLRMCNFCTPRYYDEKPARGVAYMFTGDVAFPRTLLCGGYVTFRTQNGTWFQTYYGKQHQTAPIKVAPKPGETWRRAVDIASYAKLQEIEKQPELEAATQAAQAASRSRQMALENASRDRAASLRKSIDLILAANQ